MVYQSSKCPNCKKYLYRNKTNVEEYMPSSLPCPHCGKMFKTGKKMYYEMSSKEKEKIDDIINSPIGFKNFLRECIDGLFLMFIPAGLICEIFDFYDYFIIVLAICCIIYSAFTYKKFSENEKKYFLSLKLMTYRDFMESYYKKLFLENVDPTLYNEYMSNLKD